MQGPAQGRELPIEVIADYDIIGDITIIVIREVPSRESFLRQKLFEWNFNLIIRIRREWREVFRVYVIYWVLI